MVIYYIYVFGKGYMGELFCVFLSGGFVIKFVEVINGYFGV